MEFFFVYCFEFFLVVVVVFCFDVNFVVVFVDQEFVNGVEFKGFFNFFFIVGYYFCVFDEVFEEFLDELMFFNCFMVFEDVVGFFNKFFQIVFIVVVDVNNVDDFFFEFVVEVIFFNEFFFCWIRIVYDYVFEFIFFKEGQESFVGVFFNFFMNLWVFCFLMCL